MRLTIELKEEILAEAIQYAHSVYRAIEDEELDDIEDLSDGFATLLNAAENIMEWVAQAKASLARHGVAA